MQRWAPLRVAASYSAIGRKRLVALAKAGTIRGFPDPDSGRGDWIFDLQSLDAYRLAQSERFQAESADSVAMEILTTIDKRTAAQL